MTVLLISGNFPPVVGGSARWLWEIYRRFPRGQVWIAAGRCEGAGDFDRTHELGVTRMPLALAGQGVFNLSGWRRYRDAGRTARVLAARVGATAVHCGRVLPEGWIARGTGLPFGIFAHGEEFASYASSRELTWMARRVMRRAALFVANSQNTAAILARDWGVPAARLTVVSPGVDVGRFTPAPRNDAVRAALGWKDRLVVLTVGRLQRRKGHDRMIEAVALLREQFPALLYAIVGDGSERDALEAAVQRAGLAAHVRFHGMLDDDQLVRAYQQCDLFALPNRTDGIDFEGFGMVLLEAQACGRAVLAGDSGGTAEALRAGETGLIVDCRRPDPLAAAVAALLRDPARCEQLGAAGRQWVARERSFDVLAPQAAKVLAGMEAR